MARCAALLALVLAGCAADCANGDWRARGHRDGYFGHPAQDMRLARCPGFSESSYLEGWRAGQAEYDRTGSY